jgi:hypothetical protein
VQEHERAQIFDLLLTNLQKVQESLLFLPGQKGNQRKKIIHPTTWNIT